MFGNVLYLDMFYLTLQCCGVRLLLFFLLKSGCCFTVLWASSLRGVLDMCMY